MHTGQPPVLAIATCFTGGRCGIYHHPKRSSVCELLAQMLTAEPSHKESPPEWTQLRMVDVQGEGLPSPPKLGSSLHSEPNPCLKHPPPNVGKMLSYYLIHDLGLWVFMNLNISMLLSEAVPCQFLVLDEGLRTVAKKNLKFGTGLFAGDFLTSTAHARMCWWELALITSSTPLCLVGL